MLEIRVRLSSVESGPSLSLARGMPHCSNLCCAWAGQGLTLHLRKSRGGCHSRPPGSRRPFPMPPAVPASQDSHPCQSPQQFAHSACEITRKGDFTNPKQFYRKTCRRHHVFRRLRTLSSTSITFSIFPQDHTRISSPAIRSVVEGLQRFQRLGGRPST